MADAAPRQATYEDLLAVPDNLVAEILGGTLHTSPRPAPRHTNAASSMGMLLGGPFRFGKDGPGGWWIIDEPELHLGADVLVPDIAGWRRETLPALPETAWFETRPDWVCEILSPSTAKTDRTLKLPIYAREQVAHLWLIDPELQTLEAYELGDGGWTLLKTLKDDDPVRLPPFDAIEFSLGDLWG